MNWSMQRIRAVMVIAWASPWTVFGLLVGRLMLLCCGGHVWPRGFGGTAAEMDACREHELVHVRKYERWGVFFVPAYLICWLVLTLRGRSGYWDNPFEREAYQSAD